VTFVALQNAAEDTTPIISATTSAAAAPPPPQSPPPPPDRTEKDDDGWFYNFETEAWENDGSKAGAGNSTAAAAGEVVSAQEPDGEASPVEAAATPDGGAAPVTFQDGMVSAAVLRDKHALAAEALRKQQGGSQSDGDERASTEASSSSNSGSEGDDSEVPVDISDSDLPLAERKAQYQRLRAAAITAALRTGDWTNNNGFAAMTAASPGVPSTAPLDPSAAAGAGRVLVASNSVIQVHDSSSGSLEKAVRLSAMFSPVIAEFSMHNVQRSPSVMFDRAESRFLITAESHDTGYRDVFSPGRILLGVTSESNPMMLWRIMSIPSPPCDPGLYAQSDMPSVSHSKHGVYVSMVLRCYEPSTKVLKSSAARILAIDKVRLSSCHFGGELRERCPRAAEISP